MLERTAAGLDTCKLQRVLPQSSRLAKRPRKLHTGFWQHGASAIELSHIWPLPPATAESDFSAARPLPPSLLASAFLLDFLYPSIDFRRLRRLYPSFAQPRDGSRTSLPPTGRPYTSSVATEPMRSEEGSTLGLMDPQNYKHVDKKLSDTTWKRRSERSTPTRLKDVAPDEESSLMVGRAAQTAQRQLDEGPACSQPNAMVLADLLAKPEQRRYEYVWKLYCDVPQAEQTDLRPALVRYLSQSPTVEETGRAMSLIRRVAREQWDDSFLAAAVLVLLRSGDSWAALDMTKKGLAYKGLCGGIEYIVADAFSRGRWAVLLDVWQTFESPDLDATAKASHLARMSDALAVVPNLGALYLSFEQYLKTDEVVNDPLNDAKDRATIDIDAIRQTFAAIALRQPCRPNEALSILEGFGNAHMYHDYLLRIFEPGTAEQKDKSTLVQLPNIYKKFRVLPGAYASTKVLRGLFQVYYPHDAKGLQEIYQDMLRTRRNGELNEWGFKAFLKFFAYTGDIKAVQDLWKRYIDQFPRALTSVKTFHSMVNAYAQIGDVEGVQEQIRMISDQYGLEPDINIMNATLKCYSRAGDYARVLEYFDEICSKQQPDSFTYAHVMATCAQRGDLVATLDLLARAQAASVAVSREMVLALVTAYARNGQLDEAEKVCRECTDRKVTSTAVWNELIRFNGLHGRIKRCKELVQAMEGYSVERDMETYEYLLEAMVQVGQVDEAILLLRKARREKLFVVNSEHFAVALAGALRRRDRERLVKAIDMEMEDSKVEGEFNALVALTQNAHRTFPAGERAAAMADAMVACLRSFANETNETGSSELQFRQSRDPRELRRYSRKIGKAVFVLVEMRDFASVEELLTLFREIVLKGNKEQGLPQDVVSALMTAYANDGHWEHVCEMFEENLAATLRKGKREDGSGVYPAHEYDLCRLVSTMIDMYKEQWDGSGLIKFIERITRLGFKLTSTNWDRIVHTLVDMGHWYQAMEWCERVLMPRFVGEGKNPNRRDEERECRNTRVVRAALPAIRALQQQWLELRKAAPWSPDIAEELKDVRRRFPRLNTAFIDLLYNSRAVTGRMQDPNAPIDDVLKPLSLSELRDLRWSLLRQVSAEQNITGDDLDVPKQEFGRYIADEDEEARDRRLLRRKMGEMKKRMQKPDMDRMRDILINSTTTRMEGKPSK